MTQGLADNYRGAFDGSLGFGDTPALILIDLVQAYFDKDSPLYANVEDTLASALRIRDAARVAGIPIIYTNVVYQQGGANGGVFYRKVPALEAFVAGNPLGRWADGIEPAADELVISKQYPSAFFGTSLAATLTANKVDTLIITGLTTSGCIRATCVDAVSSGFVPIVVSDACGDRHEAPHEANLFDMNAKYADVIDEETAIKQLTSE
ncbi:MAG: isochorismatase family protein [Gammaproteobacteria bacterium]|nr:isochorismatase family protein [Gammaproteobacteria bacterium]NNL51645.1 isochorismatase family protein [Woeseiaceae bacterium]